MFHQILNFLRLKRQVPSAKWINDVHLAMKYTPDVIFLEQRPEWLVFIYGEDKLDHPANKRLVEAKYCLDGYTVSEYVLWKYHGGKDHWSWALPIDNPFNPGLKEDWNLRPGHLCRIKGQVFRCSTSTIFLLDEAYKNGVEFERRYVSLTVPYRFLLENNQGIKSVSERYEEIISAWMYIGNQKFWEQVMDGSFSPVRLYQPTNEIIKPYYSFERIEHEDE